MSLRADHAESTRAALVKAARYLFSRKGYGQTSVDEIVARARVTKGAMYHHYQDKAGLFRDVFEQVESDLVDGIARTVFSQEDPWDQFRVGVKAFLDACLDAGVRRIVLLDGPSVLGWETWRQIDAKYGLGLIKTGLEALVQAGRLPPQPLDPLAHLILGSLNEAGMLIAHASDREAARKEVGEILERFISNLVETRRRR